jgi:hypothetical protein
VECVIEAKTDRTDGVIAAKTDRADGVIAAKTDRAERNPGALAKGCSDARSGWVERREIENIKFYLL